MKKEGFNKKIRIVLFILIAIIAIIIIFYSYLIFQFKINDIVYGRNKGLGRIKGISLIGEYLVQWQDGSFSKETLSSLKNKDKLKTNEIDLVVKKNNKPDYFFYPIDNGKRAIILNNYSGNAVIGSDIIPSYEEKGKFVWRIGKKDCKPIFICEDWSKCKAIYNLESLLSKELIRGTRSRSCRDYARCFSDFVEFEDCEIKEEILTKKIAIGDKDYLEVYDIKNNPIARLEFLNATRKLNIQIISDKFGYYPYCYNNINDYDEDEIDCVYEKDKHCPICEEKL